MAEKLTLDDGVLELEINENGLLRFNPTDPNLYQRFLALARELPELEKRYQAEAEQSGGQGDELTRAEDTLERMKAMDAEVKGWLAEVFGAENDFDVLLGGVSLMAVGRNGQRVVSNLLNALSPYMEAGLQRYRQERADEAVAEARANRAQRRAE